MSVRVATFNCENLFARYRFRASHAPRREDGFTRNNLAYAGFSSDEKRITGAAIRETDADIICLQEVENLDVLDRFVSQYLNRMGYEHRVVIDGNDPRFIDVAVLSRFPFVYLNTHRHERRASSNVSVFSRDCLEVDVNVRGRTLSLYVNHFKSMMGGRGATRARRMEQARRVSAIVRGHWRPLQYQGNFIVCGDLNDYPQDNTSLGSLLRNRQLVNVVNRLPVSERWTHFYAGGNEYRQLDYLLVSRALAEENAGREPVIVRNGMPRRAARYTGARLRGVGENRPKASDHCPLAIDLDLL